MRLASLGNRPETNHHHRAAFVRGRYRAAAAREIRKGSLLDFLTTCKVAMGLPGMAAAGMTGFVA